MMAEEHRIYFTIDMPFTDSDWADARVDTRGDGWIQITIPQTDVTWTIPRDHVRCID